MARGLSPYRMALRQRLAARREKRIAARRMVARYDTFPAASHEAALDRAVLFAQEQGDRRAGEAGCPACCPPPRPLLPGGGAAALIIRKVGEAGEALLRRPSGGRTGRRGPASC